MKLVEILARDLKAWPKNHRGNDGITQDEGGDLNSLDTGCDPSFCEVVKCWKARSHSYLGKSLEEAEDFATAVVTKGQWQAERERQKGVEWKRHRGGKQPVADEVRVEFKFRSGVTGECLAGDLLWDHQKQDDDVMQYRIISQPQAEEVEVRIFEGRDVRMEELMTGRSLPYETHCGEVIHGPISIGDEVIAPAHPEYKGTDTNMGTLSYTVDIDTSPAIKALNELSAKWDQVESPFKWRDTVSELDAYIEKFTRERESLINRLALEGFALIPAMTAVMGVADIDMSDWRNWKAGDVVEVILDNCSDLPIGERYVVKKIEVPDYEFGMPVCVRTGSDPFNYQWAADAEGQDRLVFKFIRRP